MRPTIHRQLVTARTRRLIAVLAVSAAAALTGQQAATAAALPAVHFNAPAAHVFAAPAVHFYAQTSGAAAGRVYNCNW